MKTFDHGSEEYDITNIPIGEEIYNQGQNRYGIVLKRYTCECYRPGGVGKCPDCKIDGKAYWVRRMEDDKEVGWCYGLWR